MNCPECAYVMTDFHRWSTHLGTYKGFICERVIGKKIIGDQEFKFRCGTTLGVKRGA